MLPSAIWGCLLLAAYRSLAQTPAEEQIYLEVIQGTVEIFRGGANVGVQTTQTNHVMPFDRLRVSPTSRVRIRFSSHSVVTLGPGTECDILPPHEPGAESGLHLFRGLLAFFHRGEPNRIRVLTQGTRAGIRGTEFVISVESVNNLEHTTLSVIDGVVEFTNPQGALTLTSTQQAVADEGKAPVLTRGFIANNLMQWCFYYPAVLDLQDLSLTPAEQPALTESLAAYREGDVPAALARYPAGRQPASAAERVYHAALLLAVGQAQQAEATLAALQPAEATERLQRTTAALRQLIAAVKREPNPSTFQPQLSTELLAASYYEQSRAIRETSLQTALHLARQAVTNSPDFSFAWARVAELEFSFGHTSRALEALNKSLALAPRNAQAIALQGFLHAAQNKTREALDSFNQSITLDPALGNAWLGRGLCRIRRGDTQGGRHDLLIAAALEPQRSLLRSYLGKAYANAGDTNHAFSELALAKRLDTNDPTPWLYSALLNEQNNRINQGIRDLEKSQELNDNRRVYRSRLRLDEDYSIRSANLARMYQESGMQEVGLREASRAVDADYANYSSHLFLAEAYNALRDPNQVTLRYEAPTLAEYLIGNLLAPVNAGVFSPAISQGEYSNMLESQRLGLISSTEYSSRGAWVQSAAQYGRFEKASYSLDSYYRSDSGARPNNQVEQTQFDLRLKQQISPQDQFFVWALSYWDEAGDLRQLYNPVQANLNLDLRTRESVRPLLTAGYHHEWNPDSHTIFVTGLAQDSYQVDATTFPTLVISRPSGNVNNAFNDIAVSQAYKSDFTVYSSELQQISVSRIGTLVAGARFQHGTFKTQERITQPSDPGRLPLSDPPDLFSQQVSEDFDRASAYAYFLWDTLPSLRLVGGLSYDWIAFPQNWRFAPASEGRQHESALLPKAGLVWTPDEHIILRAAFTRSLAGASLDQSLQIEPSQVAGLNQLYRSLIPESIAGANAGAHFETRIVSLEYRFKPGTFAGLRAEWLQSYLVRQHGAFIVDADVQDFAFASSTPERLKFTERSLVATLDQLIDRDWSLGVHYRLTQADYESRFTDGAVAAFQPETRQRACLHQITLQAIYNHPSGFFGQFQANRFAQHNEQDISNLPGDEFWQLNVVAGYRFPRRRAELAFGLLNLTDCDYRLHPLTVSAELPHERTFVARFKLSF